MVVYGIGSRYVHEVDEMLRRLDMRVTAYVNNLRDTPHPEDLSPAVYPEEIQPAWRDLPVTIPLITPGHRKPVHAQCVELGFSSFPAIVDPTAIVASSSSLAEGVSVNAAVVIGAKCTLGRFALVNRSVSIGHDCVLEEFSTLGPGALLCGQCRIMPGAFVGGGSILLPGITVGRNAIVGAGAVVTKDIPDHCVAIGNPAKIFKTDVAGYNNVGV